MSDTRGLRRLIRFPWRSRTRIKRDIDDEFQFHATVIFASGGMILSGDDLTTIAPARLTMLKKLQPPTGVAARFADTSLGVGNVELPGRQAFCLLNWDDTPQVKSFTLGGAHRVRDFWTDQDMGLLAGGPHQFTLPPHSGRVLVCTPV